ncbi:hypothetical protein M0R72_08335 [Candidatus Pacearchaeota archaeon]|jgi:hypothetical protein|nr:hypothetical protein [Candidatus Pacearchaeota archaeon]
MMDIKRCRIDMKVRAPNGQEAKIAGITRDNTVHVDFGPGEYHWVKFSASDIEPVSDPCHFAIGDTVRVARKVDIEGIGWSFAMNELLGKVFTIENIRADGNVILVEDYHTWPVASLDKVSDPRDDCQKFEAIRLKAFWEGKASCHEQIAGLLSSRDYWQASCGSARRDAAYWHEELEKLQKEALAETQHFYCDDVVDCRILPFHLRPLSEVAKCYKQVAPEKLLMSQEARRVNHLLDTEGPNDYRSIAVTFGGDWGKTMDGIIELLDAGKIRLVDGKYEIVGD